LAALGGASGSSVILVNARGKAPFYTQQRHGFLHIADKHVNRENSVAHTDHPLTTFIFNKIPALGR
jgi:hypothetical protein